MSCLMRALTVALLASAYMPPLWAKPLRCPAELKSEFIEGRVWGAAYGGKLKEVVVNVIRYQDGQEVHTLECIRERGAITSLDGRHCRIEKAGAGVIISKQVFLTTSNRCLLNDGAERDTNDMQCVIECEH